MQHTVLCSFIIVLLAISATWACIPEDADRSAQVVFSNGEQLDLSVLRVAGTEGKEYFVEKMEMKEGKAGTMLIYRSSFDPESMVKVGWDRYLEWPSLMVVLSEKADAEAFDFARAIQTELQNLLRIAALSDFDTAQLPEIVKKIGQGARLFTKEMGVTTMGCVSVDPLVCMKCEGPASFTELPPGRLFGTTPVRVSTWGKIKGAFVHFYQGVQSIW